MKKSKNKIIDNTRKQEKTLLDKKKVILHERQEENMIEKKEQHNSFPKNVDLNINSLSEKTAPVADDLLLLRDSETNTRKKIKYSNL